ncbi:MAG: hypothetical protein HC881_00505 [Leptolyngbyaceae cyanobacterium SL_7_1]|nr:hypothetical protein [Leptolyngbyaceae cyanobacterium SL_7_1]
MRSIASVARCIANGSHDNRCVGDRTGNGSACTGNGSRGNGMGSDRIVSVLKTLND